MSSKSSLFFFLLYTLHEASSAAIDLRPYKSSHSASIEARTTCPIPSNGTTQEGFGFQLYSGRDIHNHDLYSQTGIGSAYLCAQICSNYARSGCLAASWQASTGFCGLKTTTQTCGVASVDHDLIVVDPSTVR